MKNLTFKRYDSLELLSIFTDDEGKVYRFFLHDIATAREKYGGSFLQALAVLLYRADYENENKIMNTWHNYVAQFYNQGLLEPFDILDTNQN